MDFNEYQRLAMRTAGGYDTRIEELKLAALGIGGEAGEYIDLVKKQLYHSKFIDPILKMKELGDILWYIAVACDADGFNMNDIAHMNIDKLKKRYPEGFNIDAANAKRIE